MTSKYSIVKYLINFHKTATALTLFCLLVVGCSDEQVNRANYLPKDACVVLSVNTEEIFSDAFFDLLLNNNFMDQIGEGPLLGVLKDPANAGVKRLDKYYFFATGSNFMDAKLGAVLPLNDSEDLASYIEKNFGAEVTTDNGFLVADLSNEQKIVWNEQTAIVYFGAFGGDLVNEAQALFMQKEAQSLEQSDSTLAYALQSDAHVAGWFKNDDFVDMVDMGLEMAVNFKLFQSLNVNKEDIKGAKSVFLGDFSKGKFSVVQRQYLNSTQMRVYNSFNKPNQVAKLSPIVSKTNPLAVISTSLKSEGFLELLKEYELDKAWDKQLQNAPIKIKLDQVAQFFEGDGLLMVNGFDEVTQEVAYTDMDDEGNDVVTTKVVQSLKPQITLGLTAKSPQKLALFLGMLTGQLPKYNSFSNYNNELYFGMKDELFIVTTTAQGVDAVLNPEVHLDSVLNNIITAHRTAVTVDFEALVASQKEYISMLSGASNDFDNLKNLVITEVGIEQEGIVKGEFSLNFKNDENGLISLVQLLNTSFKALSPFLKDFM